jgi:hypothetical protein
MVIVQTIVNIVIPDIAMAIGLTAGVVNKLPAVTGTKLPAVVEAVSAALTFLSIDGLDRGA